MKRKRDKKLIELSLEELLKEIEKEQPELDDNEWDDIVKIYESNS
jgi:hypothetical protein